MTEQKRPEISIIVPVYKVEKYLNECIDSILAQTFTDFELILVDDGSPDNCPALCDAAAAKDSRIRVIHQQNKGLSGARNAGIEIARGNWLSFIDSDDSVDKTFCEKLYHAAKQAGAKLVVSDILYFDADGSDGDPFTGRGSAPHPAYTAGSCNNETVQPGTVCGASFSDRAEL